MRDFYGVILIDVWISQHAGVNRFYDDLCDFLIQNIRFQHLILPNFGSRPMDTRFRQLGRVSTIDCWTDFKNLAYNQGDWLLGGQSWGMCTHHRELGLIPALKHGIEARLFSHPRVMFPALDQSPVMSNSDFEQDELIRWKCQPDGFWLAEGLASSVSTDAISRIAGSEGTWLDHGNHIASTTDVTDGLIDHTA